MPQIYIPEEAHRILTARAEAHGAPLAQMVAALATLYAEEAVAVALRNVQAAARQKRAEQMARRRALRAPVGAAAAGEATA